MRGVEAELEGGLVGGQAEVGEQVADLLLRGVDDLTGRGLVDGGGHVRAELLEVTAQLVEQILGRKLGLVVHGVLAKKKPRVQAGAARRLHVLSGGYDLPEDLPHRVESIACEFFDFPSA